MNFRESQDAKSTNSDFSHNSSGRQSHGSDIDDEGRPVVSLRILFREYAREKPEIVAACFFGIGFVLGWKLKPW